jgi:hypothetical protein
MILKLPNEKCIKYIDDLNIIYDPFMDKQITYHTYDIFITEKELKKLNLDYMEEELNNFDI